MKKISLLLVCICLMMSVFGQNVTINPTGITPQTSGSYPRISYDQIIALPSPLKGDLAYDLTFDCLRVFNGVKWLNLLTGQDINKPASLAWALKSNDFLSVLDIEKDANGNIFVIGNFTGVATFGTIQKTSIGDTDVFLAKYTDNGTLLWIKTAGSVAGDSVYDLKIDTAGNPIISGYFFDAISFEGTILPYTGISDIFIVKFNTSGSLIWAKRTSGLTLDLINSIETDATNNIYITGSTRGSITFFGSTNISLNTSGLRDGFIAKYDPNGNVLWAKLIGSASENDIGNIKIANSTIFVSGTYSGSVDLGNAVILNSSTGSNDIFLSRFDLNGNCLNALNLGSSTTEIKKLVVDASSNVYICGTIYGPTSIGGIALSNNVNYLSAFFAKTNSSLAFAFAKTLSSNNSSSANSIQVDGSGNIYVLGNFSSTISNGPQSILSNGDFDIFLAKYSPIGGAISILSYGGSGFDTANNFLVGPSNFIAGSFNGSINLGTVLTTSSTTIGSLNGFVVRISE